MTLGVAHAPAFAGVAVGANVDEALLSTGAITGEVGAISTSGWGESEILFLTCASEQDETGETLQAGGVTPTLSFAEWFAKVEAGQSWGSSGPTFSDEVIPAWVEVVSGSASSTTRQLDEAPAPRWVMRHADDYRNTGGEDALYLFPPIASDDPTLALTQASKLSTGYWVRRHQLGYVDLQGVEIAVSDAAPPADWGYTYAPGAATSALRARRLQTIQDELFAKATRLHHIGPCPNPAFEDLDSGFTGAVDKVTGQVAFSTSWQSVARCIVGSDDLYETADDNYTRTSCTVEALLAVVAHNFGDLPGSRDADLDYGSTRIAMDLRLQLGPLTTSATVTGTPANGGGVDALEFSPHFFSASGSGRDLVGYWMGFLPWKDANFEGGSDYTTPGQAAGRGLFPEWMWRSVRFHRIKLHLQDNVGGANRLLDLQAKFPSTTTDGKQTAQIAPRLHLLTWTVYSTPGLEPDVIGIT